MSRSIIWFHDEPSKSNQICLYCGIHVGEDSTVPSDEEHLVGRNFVPRGTMENEFNFSFRACKKCNGHKATLEDHLSGLTLLNSPSVATSEKARLAAGRKASGSVHPEKKVPIGSAWEQEEIQISFGPMSMKFGLSGPPRPAGDFIPDLACYHIQGLFSLMTTKDHRREGSIRRLPPEQFRYFDYYPHSDWGNPRLSEIIRRGSEIPHRAVFRSGSDHFRACLRRSENHGWFWALEWNKSLRIVGAICFPHESPPWFEALPKLTWLKLPDGSLIREEQSEPDLGDLLFPSPDSSHP